MLEYKVAALPGGASHWFALTRWLRGHEYQTNEVIVASFFA